MSLPDYARTCNYARHGNRGRPMGGDVRCLCGNRQGEELSATMRTGES
jgi:hypothetical protein